MPDPVLRAIKIVGGYTLAGGVIAAVVVAVILLIPRPSPGSSRIWGLYAVYAFAVIAGEIGAMLGFVIGVARAFWR